MVLTNDFWNRTSSQVARDLVGRTLVEFGNHGNAVVYGLLTEVDAYNDSLTEQNRGIFYLKPGTIGIFGSRRGPIPIIAAHGTGKSGLVTLRKLINGNNEYGPTDISELLKFQEKMNTGFGLESGLYVGESGIDYSRAGFVIVDQMPTSGPDNRVAYYRLVKHR